MAKCRNPRSCSWLCCPLIHALFCDVNPMPVKAAMNLLGWNAGSCRMPLIDLDEAQTARVRTELQKAGLL